MASRFVPASNPSVFRRIAASMWNRPNDPTIYGYIDVDVSETLDVIDRLRRDTGRHVTMTHIVAHATARAFAKYPELNAKVRLWGRVEYRESVDLLISVATDGSRDLAAAKIESAADMGLLELVDVIRAEVDETRNDRDAHQSSRSIIRRLPWWMVRPALWLTNTVGNELNLDLPALGMPRDPFGTAIITNVGSFGIDTAFAPLPPLSRAPMLLLVTEVRDRATCVAGRVVPRPTVRVCASFDHRIIDGVQAGRFAEQLRCGILNPDAGASLSQIQVA